MPIFKDKQYFRVNLEKEADEALWLRCKSCGELVFKRRVRENNNICPNCGEYFFLTARERVESLIDEETFEDVSKPIVADDPLGFQDEKPYPQRLEEAQEKTGLPSAIILASAKIEQMPVVLGVMEFQFIGGSMGSVMNKFATGWRRRSGDAARSSSFHPPVERECKRARLPCYRW